jgi:hypothetical protein
MNIPVGDIVEPEKERPADDPGGTGYRESGFQETIKIGTIRANRCILRASNSAANMRLVDSAALSRVLSIELVKTDGRMSYPCRVPVSLAGDVNAGCLEVAVG